MERKVTKLPHSHVEVVVTVDEKTWNDAQEKAFQKLANDITVKGFRKGKAPRNLVESRIDQVKKMDEAINALLPVLYKDILDNEDIHPYAQPKVDVTKLSATELEVKFTIVTAPEIKIGKYTGLEIGKVEPTVSEDDVKAAIDAALAQSASLVVKEGESAMGDTVVIDFVGSVDGKTFEGGSAENYELELGSHSFIPGFEEQLVGKKAEEKVDVNVKFPENYTPELKGKDAVFACTIHEVKEKKLPELNDEFVAELKIPDVTTVEQFKEFKNKEILTRKINEARRDYMSKLLDTIAKDSTVDIPDEVLESQVGYRKEDLVKRMQQSGLTLEQYLSIIGQKEEDFLAKLKEESVRDVTNFLIVEEAANKENIKVTPEDVDFEMAKIAEQYSMSVEDVKKALEPQHDEFVRNLRSQRIEQFLYENNK